MRSFERATQQKFFYVFSIALLIFSLLTTAIPAQISRAEDSGNQNEEYEEGHGSIKNDGGELDYDEATINKEISF